MVLFDLHRKPVCLSGRHAELILMGLLVEDRENFGAAYWWRLIMNSRGVRMYKGTKRKSRVYRPGGHEITIFFVFFAIKIK